MSEQLAEKTPDRAEVRLLTRHLSVAVLGVAACHVGLEEDGQAIDGIAAQMPVLRQASRWMFHETAGKDPARFLSLPVGGREVSLAFLADLFQQAKLAGILDAERDFTPDGWYEAHRATIWPFARRLPYTYQGAYVAGLQQELLAAVVAVEEVNRVRGIELLAREVQATGERSREVMGQLRQAINSGGGEGEQVVWALAPKPPAPSDGHPG